MKKVKVVIGANFGDEGKGLMTDYFCRCMKNSLNVRFNGTCQAGHTVVTDEHTHVFSHIGAGAFAGATTLLSSYFYCNPTLFRQEYEKLNAMGYYPKVLVDCKSPIITIADIFANRIIETNRGENRHGSCGMGLWEAVKRQDSIPFSIQDLLQDETMVNLQLKAIFGHHYFALEEQGVDCNKVQLESMTYFENGVKKYINFLDPTLRTAFLEDCKYFLSKVEIVDEQEVLNNYDNIVFEGAQGLRLDCDNEEYAPHLTASKTGIHNVRELIGKDRFEHMGDDIEVCYVTRSYLTKHGAGRFDTEIDKSTIATRLGVLQEDETNVDNEWQGSLRYGIFPKNYLYNMIKKDAIDVKNYCICVTHMDDLCHKKRWDDNLDCALGEYNKHIKYTSNGRKSYNVCRCKGYNK